MDSLVRKLFSITSDTPDEVQEELFAQAAEHDIVWGSDEQEIYEWAIEDMEAAEERGDAAEYERYLWLTDALGDIRHRAISKVYSEEIVADYQPSEFEITYAKLIFGEKEYIQ